MSARNLSLTLVSGAFLCLTATQAQQQPAVPAVPAVPQQIAPPQTAVPPPQPRPAAPAPLHGTAAQRYRGTLQAFDGPFITLKTTETRQAITLGMTTQTRIVHSRALKLAELTPGTFVAVVVLVGGDGKMRAQGIRSYPPNLRAGNEGRYAIDPANPSRMLVGGTISAVTPGGIGGTLTIAFHGFGPDHAGICGGKASLVAGGTGCDGTAEIQFARGVPILALEDGDVSMLLPGAVITAAASPDATGTLVATSITVERDAPAPKPAPPPPQ